MLNSTKLKSQGFTIVELLIVIVVIAILAAISIVAYNGIQNRGKTSAAQSLASQLSKKAEAWNTIQSSYPTYCQLAFNRSNATGTGTATGTTGCTTGATAGPEEAKLDDVTKLNAANPSNENTVRYAKCTTGAQVIWYSAQDSAIQYIGIGGAGSTALCAGATAA